MSEPWVDAYKARFSESNFGADAIGLFALGLIFSIDDLDSLAPDIMTGGGDDKKCDIVYLDKEDGHAVVAQCYESTSWEKQAAPSNKASDLNTAVGWLLSAEINAVPERLRASATELREAIRDGSIHKIELWYVHNLPESKNCSDELAVVKKTATAYVGHIASSILNISAREIGFTTLKQIFEDSRAPILVSDEIGFKTSSAFEFKSDNWSSVVTVMPGERLRDLYKKHKTRLFSANVRDYLGARATDSNINNGIRETAERDPSNFLVFNNGVTALVHDYQLKKVKNGVNVKLNGISIVNGAQTTGAIGNLPDKIDDSLFVPVRFIKTSDEKIFTI